MITIIPKKQPICSFQGEYRFLSNFYVLQNSWSFLHHSCPTTEHGYQLSKTLDVNERIKIANSSLKDVKKLGREVTLRPDWDEVKVSIMYKILMSKFKDPELRDKLISTEDALLIEGNTWHDNFWGFHVQSYDEFDEINYDTKHILCSPNCAHNQLGKLLMMVRVAVTADVHLLIHRYHIGTDA